MVISFYLTEEPSQKSTVSLFNLSVLENLDDIRLRLFFNDSWLAGSPCDTTWPVFC